MTQTPSPEEWHYTADELADYFDDEMPDDEIAEVEEHLGRCSACMALANRVNERLLAIEEWSPRAHGEAYRAVRVAEALDRAERQHPNFEPGLRERLDRMRAMAGGAVRAVIRSAPDVPRLATQVLHRVQAGGAEPELALEGLWTRGGGGVRVLGEARAQAGEATDAAAGETPPEGDLVVRVRDLPPGAAPLVALVPLERDAPAVLLKLQPSPGKPGVARFEDLPPGEYVVVFEPPAAG